MKISGKVVHIKLEGGFWGVKGNDGKDYLPVPSLPDAFRKDGLHISADAQRVDAFTIYQWGLTVKLSNIQAL